MPYRARSREEVRLFIDSRTERSDSSNGCWIFQGPLRPTGYPSMVTYSGRGLAVHRFVYLYDVGPIPTRWHVDHMCRNKACVNPAHLEAVPGAENTRRQRHPPCPPGSTHCAAGHSLEDPKVRIEISSGWLLCSVCRTRPKPKPVPCRVPECQTLGRLRAGYCERHYRRLKRGHYLTMPNRSVTAFGKILRNTQIGESCFTWTGSLDQRGIPQLRFEGHAMYPGTFLWRLDTGEEVPASRMGHTCGNLLCVNPDHFQPCDTKAKAQAVTESGQRLAELSRQWDERATALGYERGTDSLDNFAVRFGTR